VVEPYDPKVKRKRQLRNQEIEELGFAKPTNERQATKIERAAIAAWEQRRPNLGDETCDSFAERWAVDFPKRRGESTRKHNHERVQHFGRKFAGRTLRSLTRDEARDYATEHFSQLPALRAMFNDAYDAKLVDDNHFAKLGLEQSKGREDITVLTREEVDQLAQIAVETHGPWWGPEFASLIVWSAYTCMRPGESFAARYALLEGDVYHIRNQFNSTLGRESVPKHDSVGAIYVPEEAQRAVLSKPRRLADDLIFHGKHGQQLRQESLSRAWAPVRAAFMKAISQGHHLHQRLALDPKDTLDFYELRHAGASYMLNDLEIEPWVIAKQLRHKDDGALVIKNYGHPTRTEAIKRIRRAYGANVKPIQAVREHRREETA
jgi:integrase